MLYSHTSPGAVLAFSVSGPRPLVIVSRWRTVISASSALAAADQPAPRWLVTVSSSPNRPSSRATPTSVLVTLFWQEAMSRVHSWSAPRQ